jgi:hypothetical protein
MSGAGELRFPDAPLDARGTARRVGALCARTYVPLAPELEARLSDWFAGEHADGQALRGGEVVRVGGLVLKRFPAPSVFGWVRAPRATRSAARHFWCLPVASPRPLVALWRDFRGASLLVREYVERALLAELAGRDAPADAALSEFLASLARHDVLHGDLHPRNLLWDGARWWLLDVDGVRHGLHSRARVWLGMWARLALYLGPARARELHARTLARCGPRWQLAWDEVARESEAMRARRAHDLPARGDTP